MQFFQIIKLGLFNGVRLRSIWAIVCLLSLTLLLGLPRERLLAAHTFALTFGIISAFCLLTWLNPFVYLNWIRFFMLALGMLGIYIYVQYLVTARMETLNFNNLIIGLVVFLAFVSANIDYVCSAAVVDRLHAIIISNQNNWIITSRLLYWFSMFSVRMLYIEGSVYVANRYIRSQRRLVAVVMAGCVGMIMVFMPKWLM